MPVPPLSLPQNAVDADYLLSEVVGHELRGAQELLLDQLSILSLERGQRVHSQPHHENGDQGIGQDQPAGQIALGHA